MTDERMNEIWAMLTPKEKLTIQGLYACHYTNVDFGKGYRCAYRRIFGYDNLTSQAERKCTNPSENGISEAQTASNNASPVQNRQIDYAQYRLDLAKEIAVAMIAAGWEAGDIPRDAVDDANEIVKRLKETEE